MYRFVFTVLLGESALQLSYDFTLKQFSEAVQNFKLNKMSSKLQFDCSFDFSRSGTSLLFSVKSPVVKSEGTIMTTWNPESDLGPTASAIMAQFTAEDIKAPSGFDYKATDSSITFERKSECFTQIVKGYLSALDVVEIGLVIEKLVTDLDTVPKLGK